MYPKNVLHVRFCVHFSFILLAASFWLCDAISVNMQGSVTLGKEVMDMLTHYVGGDFLLFDRRRSMSKTEPADFYTETTKQSDPCKKLLFCNKDNLKNFIEEYIITLGKAIESIFDVVTQGRLEDKQSDTIFGVDFIKVLKEIITVLKNAQYKITDDNEQYVWTGIIKKISSKMQNRVAVFIDNTIEGRTEDIIKVKKKLNQKLVLAIIAVEDTYLRKLCGVHSICLKHIECSRSLHILLENFKKMDEKLTKQFVRAFHVELDDTDFYTNLRDETVNEFQIVLSDISTTDKVSAKEVLESVQKSVACRLKYQTTTDMITGGFDTKLVNTILSDMDFIYSKHKPDPFHVFLTSFYDWQSSGSNIRTILRIVMKHMENVLKAANDDIRFKLSNEVRIFLEITVDQ